MEVYTFWPLSSSSFPPTPTSHNRKHDLFFFPSFFFFSLLHHEVCEILVPQPGIEPQAHSIEGV